jgi:hypothetical protein
MPTRQRSARRTEPEATRVGGRRNADGRGSGQAERPAGWCDTSWSMSPHRFSSPLGNAWGHIRATNSRIAADNSGHHRSRFLPAHQPHSARQRRSPRACPGSLTRKRHNVSMGHPLSAACQQIVSRSLLVTAITLWVLTGSGGFRRS